jgi:methylenetetrahydrofolate dehydrogenase (NADP+) / methenyltetrahydrofolate cyclohydrolase
MRIDGKAIASELIESLRIRVEQLKEKGLVPHLFIITFGDDAQTESYLKQKKLRAEQIAAKITIKRFNSNVKPSTVYELIEKLNQDLSVHGIIVQRPLPKQLDAEKISLAVSLPKDVDGFHPHSKFASPVGLAVIKLIETTLDHENIHEFLKSKKITIIGKGTTAGGPTIKLFKDLGFKFKVIDSKTKDRIKILKKSDIVITAVGKEILEEDELKKGAILIGIGMHTQDGKLKGDYNETDIEKVASYYSPTPGGVGPVNVTMLMKNLVEAAEQQSDIIRS